MNKLIEFFAREHIFAEILTVFVIAAGIGSTFLIKREVFPSAAYDMISVTTIYPGATAAEMEKLLTNPLEQNLKEVDGVKKMTSVSAENRSMILLQLDPGATTDKEAKDQVEEVIARTRNDLPEDAEDPTVVILESKYIPIIEVSLSGPLSDEELRTQGRLLEDRLEDLPQVARVNIIGLRDPEIRVKALPDQLARYQLTLSDIVLALRSQNVNIPGGEMLIEDDGSAKEWVVRTVSPFEGVDSIENAVIRASELGRPLLLRDVALVEETLSDATILNNTNGISALRLTVLKKEAADAIDLVEQVKSVVESSKSELHDDVKISYVNDLSIFIQRRLSVLSNNLFIGLALVMVFLSLMLPFRVALVTAVGIPFAFFGAIAYFHYYGVGINLISMMGFIIVVGMLVDDAVVITENSMKFMEKGYSPQRAAVLGTQEIWPAVTASVLTTVFAFYPLMTMSGIFGKFIKYTPYAVIVALIFSLLECYFILPSHIARWVKPLPEGKQIQDSNRVLQFTHRVWQEYVLGPYDKALSYVLKFRYIVIAVSLAFVVVTGMFTATQMKFVLFPPDGVEAFMIRAQSDMGTPLEETLELLEPIEKEVGQLSSEELDSYISTAGIQQQAVDDPATRRGPHYGQVMVFLTPEVDRSRTADEIMLSLRDEIGEVEGLDIKFERINSGPPQGRPISVGVRGRDYQKIQQAVTDLKEHIATLPGTFDLDDTLTMGKKELLVKIKPAEAAAAGLTAEDIGMTVRAAFTGVVATSLLRIDEDVDIRVTLSDEAIQGRDVLRNIKVPNRLGNRVPLTSVADFEESQGIELFEHESNQRQIRVVGEVNTDVTTAIEVANKVQEFEPTFLKEHPGIELFYGGEDFDTQESVAGLMRAFLVAICLIYALLVLLFKNLLQPLLVLTAIPLGLCGVAWAFYFHGRPLSFLGLLGAVALCGVVVNNSIVLVDFINRFKKSGEAAKDAILEAAKVRLRPIFLTTATTTAGILPTAYGLGGLDQFVVPIALALGWGVFFGAFMTVFVVPASCAIYEDLSRVLSSLWEKRFSR